MTLGISNSLRQRLGNEPDPHLHPDADLLTAYVERSLSPAEQADMVRHLAACFYCREVVALSLPEIQVQPAAVRLPGRSPWLPVSWLPMSWLPMWRWAAVAATVAVGATLVIEKPWKPAGFVPSAARNEGAVRNEVAAGDLKQIPSASTADEATPAASKQPTATTNPSVATGRPVVPPPAAQANARAVRADSLPDRFAITSHSAIALEAETRTPFQSRNSSQLVRGAAGASMNGLSGADMNAKSIAPPLPFAGGREADLVSAPAPRPVTEGASETGFVVRSIPITSEGIAKSSFAVAFDNDKNGKNDESRKKESAVYRASTDSLATIRVFRAPVKALSVGKDKLAAALSSRPNSGMALMERAPAAPAERLHWSISPDGKLIKSADLAMWHEAYPQKDSLLFKVVVSEGHDVWAGGNHMTLIHSWNGGVDWKKLKLGDVVTGDITDIQIGGGDVQVKTSNDQTFISQDGGVTWVPLKPQPK